MKDNIRILGSKLEKGSDHSIKIDKEEIRLSSDSQWKSNFIIDYILYSKDVFSDMLSEIEYKDKIIAGLEKELKTVKTDFDKDVLKQHRQFIKSLKIEFNELPVKNRIYKKVIYDWLSVKLR